MASMHMTTSWDLDAPAFPLNFDPSVLLEDTTDDLGWLQQELDLDVGVSTAVLDSPRQASEGGSENSNVVKNGFDTPSSAAMAAGASSRPTHPGVFELFQLQNLAGGNPIQQALTWEQHAEQPAALQQVPMMQPSMMAPGSQAPTMQMYQQQYQQQYQLPMQMQMQQPAVQQQQQQYMYITSGQQQVAMQQGMFSPQQLATTMPMASGMQQPNGAAPAAVSYMPQQAPDAMYGAAAASPGAAYLMPASYMQQAAAASVIDPHAGNAIGSQQAGSAARPSSGHNAAAAPKKSRSSKAAAAAPGAEKPKGPSRRFRERQKETISTLEAEVTEKLAQLQALSAENEMLKLRSAVLEATVKGREYHMKVIKEHGPAVFDASDAAQEMVANMQPCTSDCSASHSGLSTCSDDGVECCNGTATDGEMRAAHSGVSHGSCATGAAEGSDSPDAVAAAAATAATFSSWAAAGTGAAAEAATAGKGEPKAAAAAAANGQSALHALIGGFEPCPPMCDAPQKCTPAQQKRTIRCLKQMSTEEIIKHWNRFLHDVTGELLNAEQEEEAEKLRKLAHFGQGGEEDSCVSAADTVGKTCRWCSCCDSKEHTAEACQAQQLADQQANGCTSGDGAQAAAPAAGAAGYGDGEGCGPRSAPGSSCTASASRIVALVNKYSYMTKFVALLNPGVLYHLFGRNLDTGLPAAYTDDHWRQVVSRLGLSKHQVTVILACAELYFSSLNQLLEERRALQQQLKQADEGLSECQRRLLGVDGGLNQLQVLDALANNLKREHVLRLMLNCFVWGRSLNSIQFAKSAVYSHPFFPDVHAMVCVLYEDARAMAPNGQPALVFPHRQGHHQHQEQQQEEELQALHEQLRSESDGLRAEALQQELHRKSTGSQNSGGMHSALLGTLAVEAVLG